jgi:hypothetical protein
MMSLKDLKEHHYTKQCGTLCIHLRIRDVSPRDTVRGKVIIISTGQRATGQGVTFGFGLTPTLSRPHRKDGGIFDSGRGG